MHSPSNPRSRYNVGLLLWLLGVGLLLFPLANYGLGLYNQYRLKQQWADIVRSRQFARSITITEQPQIREGWPLAELSIPAIDLKVIVVEGVSDASLSQGPGRFPDSALPGDRGNCCIAGHRNMHGSWFRNLDKLSQGDRIFLSEPNARFEYRVSRKLVVPPSDTSVLNPTTDPTLTLVTCTPVPRPTHRLIIIAKMVRDRKVQ